MSRIRFGEEAINILRRFKKDLDSTQADNMDRVLWFLRNRLTEAARAGCHHCGEGEKGSPCHWCGLKN